jgi:hypothetical protein
MFFIKQPFLLIFLILISLSIQAQKVETIEVKPTGIYATIDDDRQNQMMQRLYDPATRATAVDTIFNNITDYNPPVMYLFSQALYLNGEKQPAVEWYLYAQLNALYDANRCADNSAKQAVTILESKTFPVLKDYILQHKESYVQTVDKVILLFSKLAPTYDHRWINLHGINSFTGVFDDKPDTTAVLSVDRLLWPKIKEETIQQFREMNKR